MNDAINAFKTIAADACTAAARFIEHRITQANPYLPASFEYRVWRSAFEVELLRLSAQKLETRA